MLRIGNIELDFPVVQAALSGYSDAAMRLIARRHGAPYALHEVMLDRIVLEPGRLRDKVFTIPQEDHPIGGQIMGARPEQFADAARLMAESGFDAIDLNFGCPVRKVLGRCRGGFLLSDPPTAIDIIRRVRDAVPPRTPVTVKMRRGADDSAESERNFFRIFDAAFELGAAAVTVHGRTVAQRYVGPSNWEFIACVKRHAGEKVLLGSGDLFNAADIVRMIEQTGVDGVTVARGCIGNPWIFEQARALLAGEPLPDPPSVVEQGRVVRAHFELSTQHHGERLAARLMRKFGIKYAELHPDTRQVRDAFIASKNRDDWLSVLDKWYDPAREWPPAEHKSGPGELVASGATLD